MEFVHSLHIAQALGILGFLAYLSSFAAVQLEILDGNSLTYSVSNILAAILVGISLTVDFNLASALIQGSWIVIGLSGLALRLLKTQRTAQGEIG